ncbi:TetR/AcrR family transcriptional regulator [Spelaeicoccus albus]|uniref:AcrR family transcriptional regulator n=1 Tax=Spelaeicoccus albus TaxID=1280376 RepID=A0A7Z0A9P9_9MICO|nr:TetR/AcrR family transcriptional regulator [Spelaeicoccus albus]NYI66989.1 AcrR family transcriptional regulator [Spelaeicoccus albus]
MARPKNQTLRRQQLVEATASIVLLHGAASTKLTDIAAEAGLAPSAVLYYYPDVRELYKAVLNKGGAQYCESREMSVAEASTPEERLRECIQSGVPRPGAAEEASRLLYELAPIVLRNDDAADEYEKLIARQAALYESVLEQCEASGGFALAMPVKSLARSFVALEDGYGIDVLTGAITPDEEENLLLEYARIMARRIG